MNVFGFSIGDTKFICSSEFVMTSLPVNDLVSMGLGPGWIPGVIQYEGAPIMVMDIGMMTSIESSEYKYIVVVASGQDKLAILVTDKSDYADLNEASVSGVEGLKDFDGIITGQFKHAGETTLCINIHQLLNSKFLAGSHK